MSVALSDHLTATVEEVVQRELDRRLADFSRQLQTVTNRVEKVEREHAANRTTLLVFSNDLDRLISAFIVATSSVAMGLESSMYFTFWGLTALKKQTIFQGKGFAEKLLALMLPDGPHTSQTSRMNMGGAGPLFFKYLMKKNNVESVLDLLELARELGVRLVACRMAMGVMGIVEDELIDGLEFGGVATYLEHAADSRITLFV